MAMRSRPRRSAGHLYHLRLPRLLFLLPFALLLILLARLPALLRRANAHGRQCMPAATDRPIPFPHPVPDPRLSLAIVTLADEDAGGPGARRSFRGVLAASARNKRAYAAAHGYSLVALPASAVDPSRPPSWSKVLALRAHLRHHHWLFWNDAERILFSVIGHNNFVESPDLVLTEDFGGVNAGVFFIRRSKWSEKFLDTWWNQTSFIQFGSTRSGDNAALKHLIDHLSAEEMQEHVRIVKMQCLFNSYPWILTLKSVHRLIFHLPTTWKGVYSDGDFMIHFAGLDDKQGWTNKILRERENQR
ncbi:probable alpha-1,6-mannosyltransferase MNN10 isoform X2 [Zea mays]|uniref:probable alpha-1,6-mannosyltransferase MNN10 isoform X2 n=1 Tax=Zea mays TaxID=4577 RepID=UPI0009AA20D5|nr:probable alpha-1,6-mannosyltransferase MNN10 isoform X2 [Zea mays]|eukprot:XP_020404932.1 probable alpha-1,6-mannosyltransferase MNN10 isoform X2 [Zea mays]